MAIAIVLSIIGVVLRSARWWLLALLLGGAFFFLQARADFEGADRVVFYESNGVIYVPLEIGGITELYLVDTGATGTVISRKLLSKLITKTDVVPIRIDSIALANGAVVKGYVYAVASAKLGDCEIPYMEVLILEGNSSNIVGMSVLMKLDFVGFDNKNNEMLFICPFK